MHSTRLAKRRQRGDGTDVTFGGPNLDRLYVTSIGGEGELDGALLVIDDIGITGRAEPRARLS